QASYHSAGSRIPVDPPSQSRCRSSRLSWDRIQTAGLCAVRLRFCTGASGGGNRRSRGLSWGHQAGFLFSFFLLYLFVSVLVVTHVRRGSSSETAFGSTCEKR